MATQQELFKQGKSQKDGIHKPSRHNYYPSLAVDVAPYPIDWKDLRAFAAVAKIVQEEAEALGIDIRWGGDWDRDGEWKDERFLDMPHYELVGAAVKYGSKLK